MKYNLIALLIKASQIEEKYEREESFNKLLYVADLLKIDTEGISLETIGNFRQPYDFSKMQEFFEDDLSFERMGEVLEECYTELVRYRLTDNSYTGHLRGYEDLYYLKELSKLVKDMEANSNTSK